ncbi:hypothetical protein QYF36_019436 [Acer negundo]|nr:hypothetical protein QYF36_019436 [Acer negundo]
MFEVGVSYYYCLVALVVLWISYWFYSWSNPKTKNGKLPPGSMGFPIIGESLQFFSAYSSHNIPPFIEKRVARYGPLFRTSLVGQKIVISTDNEINYSIFRQENKSFQLWYTESFGAILGNDESILGHNGKAHNYLKKLVLYLLGPEKLRKNLLQEMDEAACTHLQSWAKNGSFDIKQGSSKLIFEFIAKKVMSYDEEKDSKKLGDSCKAFIEGLISFPLNIPGTAFYASLQARKKIIKVIKDIYEDRKALRVSRRDDFVDYLIEEAEKEDTFLNDNSAINIIFGLIFFVAETTSQAVTLLLNFVSDRLDVLTELTKEHETILRKRDNENTGITWEEYKSMTFTHMVINEAMRIGNITPGIFRKVVKDVEINGKLF